MGKPTNYLFYRRSSKVTPCDILQILWEAGCPSSTLVIFEDGVVIFLHIIQDHYLNGSLQIIQFISKCQLTTFYKQRRYARYSQVEMWWHTVTHRRGKWRENWRMQWVASTSYTTSEHGVSSITTADAHTSAASSRLNWPASPGRFKWTRPFRRKTKSGFCACAITFGTQATSFSFLFVD